MKKIYSLTLKCLLICSLGLLITSCEGEDGAAGPAGANGTNGTDGKNGTDGENGIGFEDNTKYGSITFTLKGKRLDNVDFDETVEYKETSSVSQNFYRVDKSVGGDTTHYFYMRRNYKSSKKVTDGSIELNINIKNLGKATETIQYSRFGIRASIASDDLVMFPFSGSFEEGDTGVSNYKITDFAFNETTKKLTYKFSFDVDGANNRTGNPLSVSGSVDVTVLENVTPPIIY